MVLGRCSLVEALDPLGMDLEPGQGEPTRRGYSDHSKALLETIGPFRPVLGFGLGSGSSG